MTEPQIPCPAGFQLVTEHSVTIGKVWWWAQNWAQFSRRIVGLIVYGVAHPIPASCTCLVAFRRNFKKYYGTTSPSQRPHFTRSPSTRCHSWPWLGHLHVRHRGTRFPTSKACDPCAQDLGHEGSPGTMSHSPTTNDSLAEIASLACGSESLCRAGKIQCYPGNQP